MEHFSYTGGCGICISRHRRAGLGPINSYGLLVINVSYTSKEPIKEVDQAEANILNGPTFQQFREILDAHMKELKHVYT